MPKAGYVARQEEDGSLRIEFRRGFGLLLGGAIFLAVAGWLATHFVMGIVDSIRYREMLLVFPGTLLLVAMILAFGIPGWVLIFLRKHTLIDAATGEVVDVKDFLIYRRTRRYLAGTFQHVKLSKETRHERDKEGRTERTYVLYEVELVGEGNLSVLVAEMDTPEVALELGEQIAGILGVAVRDEMGWGK